MKKIRAGLLIEELELAKTNAGTPIDSKTEKHSECTITYVDIKTTEHAKALNRDIGKYVTIETDKVCRITDNDFESIVNKTAEVIRNMITISERGRILIVGIGNKNITPDSLGPKCIDRIIVTRGLEKTMPEIIGHTGFSSVCAVNTNVFGVTGIESAEITEGIASVIKPELIIAIDALSTSSIHRLCKTIQISNTAITPGGGVNNARKEISSGALEAPILSIGMPTVIDINSFFKKADISYNKSVEILGDYVDSLIVTPSDIDTATDTAAKLISFSINKALHYDLSTEEILKFLY